MKPQPRPVAVLHAQRGGRRLAKSKGGAPVWLPVVSWIFAIALALWLIWIQWFGGSSGVLGAVISGGLFSGFGQASYIIPPLLLYGLAALFSKDDKAPSGAATLLLGTVCVLLACAAELSLLKLLFTDTSISGGKAGDFTAAVFIGVSGKPGAGIFGLALLAAGLHILFRIPWHKTTGMFVEFVKEDYRAWTQGRAELAEKVESARRHTAKVKAGILPAVSAEVEMFENLDETPETKKPALKIMRGGITNQPQKVKPGREAAQEKPAKKTEQKQAENAETSERQPFNPETYEKPSITLLSEPPANRIIGPSDEEIAGAKMMLEETLASFEINATVTGALAGPVITRYELKPEKGVKVSSIVSLSNDIALAMKAKGIRVEAPIPGKDAIGFEIPNEKPVMVYLREILEDKSFKDAKAALTVAIGRYSDGAPATANLEKMPHLLVAGATNSGKSICL
ncbi:MAG: DNA translocase FtsK 4TM domain-containing protein, partial [Elusimicrobiaceae bacterium]